MKNKLTKLVHEFEGKKIITFFFKGEPYWIARNVGTALGYSHEGKIIPNKITGEWRNEFDDKIHYSIITGPELAELKIDLGLDVRTTSLIKNQTSRIMLLSEAGLQLVCIKTQKPIGRRLRKFIVNEINNLNEEKDKMNQKTLEKFVHEFEDQPITTISYKGRLCWIAKEIGTALGYSHEGKKIPNMINNEWSQEFSDETDYTVISGSELVEFKRLLKTETKLVPVFKPQKGSHLMLLYKSGLFLVCQKTNKPIGVRLRRFLADEVLPQIAHDGKFLPERSVVNDKVVNDKPINPELAFKKMELNFKIQQEARLERQKKSDTYFSLVNLLEDIGGFSKETLDTYRISAHEVLLEKSLAALKPPMEDDWETPTQIAERWGISLQRIGKVITKLGIRGDIPGICKAISNTTKNNPNKIVKSYLYSPRAVKMIEDELVTLGYTPKLQLF